MREICKSGSEGGAGQTNVPFLPLSGDVPRVSAIGGLGKLQFRIVGDSPLQACGIADQPTGRNRRAARVGIGAGERHRARSLLGEISRSGDRVVHRKAARAIQDEGGIVGNIPDAECARGRAIADLEGARGNNCFAIVGVRPGKDQRSIGAPSKPAGAGDRPAPLHATGPHRSRAKGCLVLCPRA